MQMYEATYGSRTIILQAPNIEDAIFQAQRHFKQTTLGINAGVIVRSMPSVRSSNLFAH